MLSQIERWAGAYGAEPAIHDRDPDGSWATLTWAEYWESVRRVGKGLMALGLEPGECVALVGANRRDWVICQHGINAGRAIPAPLYTTLLPEQMAYIVGNAESRIVICDDEVQLSKFISIAEGESPIEHIVTMDDLGSGDPRVITLEALMARGDAITDAELDVRLDAVTIDDVALLVYTSGTTGLPKGAMLTHEGIDLIANAVAEVYPWLLTTKQRSISYLPLCHAAEQGMTNFSALMTRSEVFYCPDLTQIRDYLVDVHPTVFLGVPRVWEKFEAALRGKLAEATGMKAKLTSWAQKTEFEAFQQEVATGRPVSSLSRKLANKLVISKIKDALGLDQLQLAVSGAAPISVSTLEFFASIGIPIHEGYGMTETTAFASVQPYGRPKLGTIGKPLPGVQAKIAKDGEIKLKGVNMVKGYHRLPDKTAELYDSDGWMYTGDLGAIDQDGYISLTGRKKDLIITAGGKNVAPAELEGYLQSIPGVGQAVVVGDRQPYLSALIVLDPEALPELEAASQISGLSDIQSAARNEELQRYIEHEMQRVCNDKVARYQTIKKITILPSDFSVDGGELTPTLKVKRNIVNEKFAAEIAAFYAEGTPAAKSARA
ncbi:MAG: long-chain fatty acid--CoA ligase [Acidimicrobiia bacterium]|nr:long-chain fatty acid--CoA ligase [Acidimicrobiia bacterium]